MLPLFKAHPRKKSSVVSAQGFAMQSRNPLQTVKHEFIKIMSCTDDVSDDVYHQLKPYLEMLDYRLQNIGERVLVVTHTSTLANQNKESVQQRLFDILTVIAMKFRDEKQAVVLETLCQELNDQKLVTDDFKAAAQLVFILFGALTMLYIPKLDPEPGSLQMRATDISTDVMRRSARTWPLPSQDLRDEDLNLSFDDILFRFAGKPHGPLPVSRDIERTAGQHDISNNFQMLRSQNVSFYTLDQLLGIEINWTTSVCEHLELNTRTRKLKLFKLPSYCLLLASRETNKNFLDSLFQRFLQIDEDDARAKTFSSAGFFREVLATYRLIFGQHPDSRALIQSRSAQGKLFGFKSPLYNAHPSGIPDEADPLLRSLCFEDSRYENMYYELDITTLKNTYKLETDFPYFAERLSLLEEYVEDQCPNHWKTLWRDRRDLAKFWTIWAVLLFGIPTVVLSVIQTVLTGLQLRQ